MKLNKEKLLIGYYLLNNEGQVMCWRGANDGKVASLDCMEIFEIESFALDHFTCSGFTKKVLSKKRQYSLYYEDRDKIAVVGKTGLEVAMGLAYIIENGSKAFAGDDSTKWCTGLHVEF